MLAAARRARLTEALPACGLLALALAALGPRPILLGAAWLAAVTPRLVEVDLAQHRLPDALVLPGYPVVLAALVLDGWAGRAAVLPAVLAGLASGLVLLLLHLAGGMGLGDVKLAPPLGALAAAVLPGGAVLALVLALLAGGLAAVVALLRQGPGARIAFGPAMLLGAWIPVLLV